MHFFNNFLWWVSQKDESDIECVRYFNSQLFSNNPSYLHRLYSRHSMNELYFFRESRYRFFLNLWRISNSKEAQIWVSEQWNISYRMYPSSSYFQSRQSAITRTLSKWLMIWPSWMILFRLKFIIQGHSVVISTVSLTRSLLKKSCHCYKTSQILISFIARRCGQTIGLLTVSVLHWRPYSFAHSSKLLLYGCSHPYFVLTTVRLCLHLFSVFIYTRLPCLFTTFFSWL